MTDTTMTKTQTELIEACQNYLGTRYSDPEIMMMAEDAERAVLKAIAKGAFEKAAEGNNGLLVVSQWDLPWGLKTPEQHRILSNAFAVVAEKANAPLSIPVAYARGTGLASKLFGTMAVRVANEAQAKLIIQCAKQEMAIGSSRKPEVA